MEAGNHVKWSPISPLQVHLSAFFRRLLNIRVWARQTQHGEKEPRRFSGCRTTSKTDWRKEAANGMRPMMKSDRKQHTFDCAEAAMFKNRLEGHNFTGHGYLMFRQALAGMECQVENVNGALV